MTLTAARTKQLQQNIQQRKQQDLFRERHSLQTGQAGYVRFNGKSLLNLTSNDYLGLGKHPKVISAYQTAAQRLGCGSGSSQLLSGYHDLHQQLEVELAEYLGFEKVVLFSSAYQANLAWQQALCNKDTLMFHDRLNHASLLDGTRLGGAKLHRYKHNDLADLKMRLKKHSDHQDKCIVTDAVFSMDGDTADLYDLYQLGHDHGALLAVDDAHGFGVLGNRGSGSYDCDSLTARRCDVYIAGLGKAAGGFGGFVGGKALLIENIIQFARPLHYSTSLPLPVVAGCLAALNVMQQEHEHRERLLDLISWFQHTTRERGITFLPSQTPIQSLVIGSKKDTLSLAAELRKAGYFVMAIRPPTVPENVSRVRVSLTAVHTEQQLEGFISCLQDLLK